MSKIYSRGITMTRISMKICSKKKVKSMTSLLNNRLETISRLWMLKAGIEMTVVLTLGAKLSNKVNSQIIKEPLLFWFHLPIIFQMRNQPTRHDSWKDQINHSHNPQNNPAGLKNINKGTSLMDRVILECQGQVPVCLELVPEQEIKWTRLGEVRICITISR